MLTSDNTPFTRYVRWGRSTRARTDMLDRLIGTATVCVENCKHMGDNAQTICVLLDSVSSNVRSNKHATFDEIATGTTT